MSKRWLTIKEESFFELVEKKSKFLAQAFPISSQQEAEEILTKIKKEYWDARHHCYAYQIGDNDEIQRFSDDGEPQGTAGKPILEVLKNLSIKNTLIVVTRYFGGTLLGTGGLVRAYGQSAKECIMLAGILEKIDVQIYKIHCDYNLSGKVEYFLKEQGYTIVDAFYTDKVIFEVQVVISNIEDFKKWIVDKTNAQILLEACEFTKISIPYIANL